MAGFLNQHGMTRFRYTTMGVGGRKQGRKWPERGRGQRGGGGGKRPARERTEEGQEGDRKGGYERPPPWLRGRAVGLWHRDRKRALGGKKERPKEFIPIELDPDREMEINQLLLSTKVKPPLSVSNRLENERQRQAEQSEQKNNKYRKAQQIQQKIKKEEDMELDDGYHWTAAGSSGQSIKREWNETADNWHDVKFKRKPIKVESEESKNDDSREPDLWDDMKPEISQLNIKSEDFSDENKQTAQNRYKHLEESAFKRKFLQSITGSIEENLQRSLSGKSSLTRDAELDMKLKESLVKKVNSRHFMDMMEFRKKLPVFDKKSSILDIIDKNQIVVLSGETGCGKTTQVAQFILDAEIEKGQGSTCHIVCTQPRRISAISVAERVADERNDTCGGSNSSVGFQIRLESKIPRSRGSIVFCTTGILLQYMYSDPALRQISHLILDEIHERDTISDFVIAILKDVIPKRPDLKLVLMSATLNAEHFSNYYGDCPSINVPGFTFPVTEYYLEDVLQMTGFRFPTRGKAREKYIKYLQRNGSEANATFEGFIKPYVRQLRSENRYSQHVLESLENPDSEDINLELILELIGYICRTQNDGAILVFLPGWDKIIGLNRLINESGSFPSYRYLIIPLHSMLSTATQRTVFLRPPPGVRKIVIATNIAETSITIDDVVYVIDCGKIKMKNFDVEKNIQTLQPEWVSLANARQRRGRAGRVQAGVCYHMFSRAREMVLAEYQLPEMLRTRLEEVILQAKTLQLGSIKPFLEKVMDPPDPRAVEISLKLLETLAALDEDENLTPLGYHLGQLPLDPQTGKMILMAAIFSCVDPIFSVAASLSFKDAFVIPMNQEDNAYQKKDELSLGLKSDHLVLAEAIRRWEQAEGRGYGRSFANEYFLSPSTLTLLTDMKTQFADHLYRMKFLNSSNPKAQDANLNSQNMALVKAIICAGLYPNIAIVKSVRRIGNGRVVAKVRTPEDGPVSIHPKSINERQAQFESRFLIYHLKIKSKQINLHDTTMVYALPLLFFGKVFSIQKHENKVILPINDEIIFTCSETTAKLIKELRTRLDWLLEHKVSHPGITDWESNCEETTLLKAIMKLITYEDQQMMMIAQEGDDFSE